MLRFVCAALFALALVAMPASISSQYAGQARAEAMTKGEKAAEKKAQKAKAKRERTEKQKAAAERQKQCGAEYREAKKSGKLAKGTSWRAFNRECLGRLKGKA
jgi:hypothetical protein